MQRNVLESIDHQALGQRLKQAREREGMTQADAAAVLDVARTTLTAIEQGTRRVKAGELIKLAQAYGRQVSDFVRARPEIVPFQVQFRSVQLTDDIDGDQIRQSIADFEDHCQDYLELESIMDSVYRPRYPQIYEIDGDQIERIAEAVAIEERSRLNVGDGPFVQLRQVLENDVGLRIFYLPLRPSGKISAMYAYSEELGGCIAVNSQHPEERRRWSLAHDYAHFLTQRERPAILPTAGYVRVPRHERFADAFAKYFLMPTSGLLKRARAHLSANGKLTVSDVLILANYYAVSAETMTHRLEELELVRPGAWMRIQEMKLPIREAQRELGLAPVAEADETFPRRYLFLAIAAYEQERISEEQLARFLHKDRLKVRRLVAEFQPADAAFFNQTAVEV
ncbi:ImmA/IrrE family metallo-endopeptidase [bacterium]|nr:ImmA/IrrE family metallo-endopeptidase [bacterium]